MAAFPELPGELRQVFPNSFWNWWQALKSYLLSSFTTQGDVGILSAGKGIIVTNAAGTVTKRIRLNNAGDGIIIEDV